MRDRPWLWVVGIASAALIVLLLTNLIAVLTKPSNEEQILAAIEDMRVATIEGRPGGVLEHLSRQFEIGGPVGDDVFQPRRQVADFIRRANVDFIEIDNISTEVSGDHAIAHADIRTSFAFAGQSVNLQLPNVQIEFRRETPRRLFVIPDPSWKVVGFGPVDLSGVRFGG